MKKLFSKRVFSCLLALTMVLGMIPLSAIFLPVSAASESSVSTTVTEESSPSTETEVRSTVNVEPSRSSYQATRSTSLSSITIGTITLQSGQYLPRGASYVTTTKPDGGYAYYNNDVLTLDGFSYWERSGNDAIYADGDLTINLIGTNVITIDKSFTSYGTGIKTTGKLTFTGSGILEINTILDYGINASGDIDFSQTGTVTVNSTNSMAIYCGNNIVVNGNLTSTSDIGYALYANNSITINKGTVNANATHPSYAAIYTRTGAVYVYGGTTNVDADGNGIYPYASSYLQYGGTVNITAYYVGIKVPNTSSTAAVYGGNLTVTSAQDGIVAPSFKIQAGRATIKSQNVKQDADYYALKLGGNSSSYLQCASHIKVTAAAEIGGTMSSISYANLPNYDHVSLVAAIKVNGVEVENGRYLASNGSSTSMSAPSSTTGYAYYKDNVLTLNNYTGSNTGTYGIYSLANLTIQQVQSSVNSLTTGSSYQGIRVQGNLTIQGLGQLKIYGGQRAVYTTGTLKVSYSQLLCYGCGIYSAGNMTLSYPMISVSQFGAAAAGTYAIESAGNISVTDGVIDVNCPDYANGQYVRGIVGKNITISGTASLELDTIGMGISGSSNITISGGNVKVNAVKGSGVYASGTLSISGGTVNVTAYNDALRGNKVTVTGGQITAISTDTSADADNCAIKVYSNSSTYFSVASTISVIGNTDTSSTGAAPFAISSLSNYDYVRIGSFVMLHNVVLPSGYYMESGNSVTAVSTTAPSSGKYAYYSNGVLTLNNYTYSGTSVAIRTYADTRINLVGGSEVNHIISHAGNLVFAGSALHVKANLGTAAINTNGDVFIDGGRITVDSGYDGIYCESFYLRGGLAWVTASYHGIDFKSNFSVSSGAITIKSTNTSGDSSYRAINSRVSNPTISITGMNHMVGKTSSPDILESVNFTSYDYDFAAIGEFVMVRGVILYKGCYLFNGDAQPYQNVGSHTEYAYLKDKNTLELKGYQYSGSAYGIASNVDLTIIIYDEENSIEAKGDYDAIHCNANLTIYGGSNYNDKITVKSANGFGIYVHNKFILDSDRVNASSSNSSTISAGECIINQKGSLTATCTYTGTTYTMAALAVDTLTVNDGYLNLTAAPNRGDALSATGNVIIKDGSIVEINSPKGDGISISDGTMTVQGGDIDITAGENGIYLYNGSYLSIQGGEVDITAGGNGIWLYSGRLNMNGGFLTVASTATSDDSSYRAIRLNGTSSDYYNVASSLMQSASVDGTGVSLTTLVPADLSKYDFVVIGDYIWVGDQKLPSGYSISPDGTMVEGNKGAGYAYYSNGTLTLNGFHYTSSLKRGILSPTNLTISVIGNSSISTAGQYCIYVYGNLTFVGSRTLTLSSERVAAIRSYGNVSVAGTDLVINAPLDTGMFAEEGSVTLSSGSLKITSFDEGISAKSMTVSGGELHVVSTYGNGIYLSDGKFTMTGGFATIICSCENIDSSISAIKLEAGSDSYNVSANLTQAASIFYTWKNAVKLVPANLNDYDYVIIGDFVEVGGVIVRSGYSVNADGTVFEGYKGTGYAYYYNGTLALDGFTYTGENVAIHAHNDLILQFKNTNELRVTGDELSDYGIVADGDLTITGNGSLNLVSKRRAVYLTTKDSEFVMNSGLLTIDTDGNGIDTNGANVIINGGTLNIDSDSYGISTGSDYDTETVTQNGGELSIYCSGYGIYTSKIRINDGKMSVKSTGIMVFGTTDIQWNEDMLVLVSDSLDESQLAPLKPNKLPTGKKYVKIENNNYVEIDGNRVFSGYSIDKNGNIIKGNGGSGYAYYYKDTLTLDGFTLTCENVAIYAHRDLILQLKNTNTLSVSGNISGIDALANLTITGTGSLSVTAQDSVNATHAIRVANNFYMQSGTVQSEGFNALRMDGENSQFVMNGGTLTLIGYGYLSKTDVTINSGSISITKRSTIDELIVNGGTLTVEGEDYAIVANSAIFNGGITIAKAHTYYVIRSDDCFKLGENMVIWTSTSTSGTNLKVDDDNRITSANKYVEIVPCNHTDVTTDKDHNCDICGKEGITDHIAVDTGYDDTYHWDICNCGQKITEKHTFTDGTCVCGKDIRGFTQQPVGGEVAYGQKLTVTWTINFDPAALILVHHFSDDMSFEELTIGATSASLSALPEGEYYTIRALIDTDGQYVESDKIYVTEKEVAEPTEQIKIKSAALKLSEDISVIYYNTIPAGYTNPYMVFSFNGKTYTIRDYEVDSNGLYCFYFPGVTPQCMGDNISATLYATYGNKEYSNTVASYSVLKYCTNQLGKNPTTALKNLLSDLLVYGEKSQLYMNYKTDQLVTSGLSLTPSTFPGLDSSYNVQKLAGTEDPNVKWSSAALVLSNNMAMQFGVTTNTPEKYTYEITISGRTTVFTHEDLVLENGRYYLYYRGIKATEFNKPVTAVIKYNGTPVSKVLTYSVNTYIYKNQNLTNALGNMLKATYNYGKSAENYGG